MAWVQGCIAAIKLARLAHAGKLFPLSSILPSLFLPLKLANHHCKVTLTVFWSSQLHTCTFIAL